VTSEELATQAGFHDAWPTCRPSGGAAHIASSKHPQTILRSNSMAARTAERDRSLRTA
jgi:hypothetical protein